MGVEPYLIAAIGALATVVTVLWRVDVGNRNREQTALRKSLDDAITRIQALEESRLNAAIQRGDEMKALAERFVKELADNSSVLRGLKDAFDTFSAALTTKPCMHDLAPQTLNPRPSTENVTRKESP
jgi:hypothetical protein